MRDPIRVPDVVVVAENRGVAMSSGSDALAEVVSNAGVAVDAGRRRVEDPSTRTEHTRHDVTRGVG
jgi:hypothetical protein